MWLEQTDASWKEGLDLAETAAHLLEAGELIPMREPPTREAYLMRQEEPNLPALRELLRRYIEILEPYRREQLKVYTASIRLGLCDFVTRSLTSACDIADNG